MGTITRPHGIKGELCVDWYADSPEFLRQTFYVQHGMEPLRKVDGARMRMHKGRPLLTLPFIKDRTEAEGLRGVQIFIHRDDLPDLSPEEQYLHDLLGYSIVDENSGKCIGTLEGVQFPTAEQMLWIIRASSGHEILFPAVEQFIVNFDEKNQCVVISPPQGLLELYFEENDGKASKKISKKSADKSSKKSSKP